MTDTGMMILIGILIVVLGGAFYGLGIKGNSRKDRPGPHNNWRSSKSTSNKSGWNESEKGDFYRGSGGEGGAD